MKNLLITLFLSGFSFLSAQNLSFTVQSPQGYTLTCANPTLGLSMSCSAVSFSCGWVSAFSATSGSNAVISAPGNYTVIVTSGTSTATQTLSIFMNTVIPVSSASSTFQVVSGTNSPQAFTFTAVSPTVNITHYFYTPMGSTMVSTGVTALYSPGGPGTYTHCIVNDANGCASCHPFVVSVGAPSTVGLDENKTTQDLLFPNPSNGFYNLTLKPGTENRITIYNSIGALIKIHDLEKEGSLLDLSDQPRGVYVIKVRGAESRTRYLRLVKE